jgi:hypothetical protein
MNSEVKAQPIRLLDVFVIGPLMIWGGHALDGAGHKIAGPVLATMGLTTIIYNGRNYETIRRRRGR